MRSAQGSFVSRRQQNPLSLGQSSSFIRGRGQVAEEHLEEWEKHRRKLFNVSFSPWSCPISVVDTCHPEPRRWTGQGSVHSLHLPALPSHGLYTPAGLGAWPGRHLFLRGSSQASRHELIRAADARKGGTEGGSRQGCPAWGAAGPRGSGRAPPLWRVCRLWPPLLCGGRTSWASRGSTGVGVGMAKCPGLQGRDLGVKPFSAACLLCDLG